MAPQLHTGNHGVLKAKAERKRSSKVQRLRWEAGRGQGPTQSLNHCEEQQGHLQGSNNVSINNNVMGVVVVILAVVVAVVVVVVVVVVLVVW